MKTLANSIALFVLIIFVSLSFHANASTDYKTPLKDIEYTPILISGVNGGTVINKAADSDDDNAYHNLTASNKDTRHFRIHKKRWRDKGHKDVSGVEKIMITIDRVSICSVDNGCSVIKEGDQTFDLLSLRDCCHEPEASPG